VERFKPVEPLPRVLQMNGGGLVNTSFHDMINSTGCKGNHLMRVAVADAESAVGPTPVVVFAPRPASFPFPGREQRDGGGGEGEDGEALRAHLTVKKNSRFLPKTSRPGVTVLTDSKGPATKTVARPSRSSSRGTRTPDLTIVSRTL
jgi:hypothetical protein